MKMNNENEIIPEIETEPKQVPQMIKSEELNVFHDIGKFRRVFSFLVKDKIRKLNIDIQKKRRPFLNKYFMEKLGISYTTIWRLLESNGDNCTLADIEKICAAFNMHPWEIWLPQEVDLDVFVEAHEAEFQSMVHGDKSNEIELNVIEKDYEFLLKEKLEKKVKGRVKAKKKKKVKNARSKNVPAQTRPIHYWPPEKDFSI